MSEPICHKREKDSEGSVDLNKIKSSSSGSIQLKRFIIDYIKIAVVPKGARNLEFEELGPTVNTIAIADEENRFFINGDHHENNDDTYDCGGTECVYSHPEDRMEKMVAYGPLKRSLVLYVCFYNPRENAGYRYKYADPSKPNPNFMPKYHWEIIDWSDCSKCCGGGIETGEPSCVEEKLGKVSPTLCKNLEKPSIQTRTCNERICTIKWRTGKWGRCLACKNQSGVRLREVECVREAAVPNGDDILVERDLCPSPKPPSRELCNSGRVCVAKKRYSADLPEEFLQKLWYQTVVDMINIDPSIRQDVVLNSRTLKKINRDLKKLRRSDWKLEKSRDITDICVTFSPSYKGANDTIQEAVTNASTEYNTETVTISAGSTTIQTNIAINETTKDKTNSTETTSPRTDKTEITTRNGTDNERKTQEKNETSRAICLDTTEAVTIDTTLVGKSKKNKSTAKVVTTYANEITTKIGKTDETDTTAANPAECANTEGSSGKNITSKNNNAATYQIKTGSIVEDRLKSQDLKIFEVPLDSILRTNISDDVFEKMGDQMPDTLDFKHKKISTGKLAAQILKEAQNTTDVNTDTL